MLTWSHACVDAGLPPIYIQYRPNMATGNWVNVWAYTPVNGFNTWSNSVPGNGFFRIFVTNMQ